MWQWARRRHPQKSAGWVSKKYYTTIGNNKWVFSGEAKITKLTGWHSHHLVYRSHGGTDGNSNRVLLHPNCHKQVHSKGLEVVKPRLKRGVK